MSASSRRRITAVGVEALALLALVALLLAKLAQVAGGSWRAVFLANGDSLVLPLLLRSLQHGEPFDWVFSSQTFFFPEFPLYAACGLIMGTPQGGLVLNALLNVVLLYLGFRALSAAVFPGVRARQVAVSLLAVGLFVVAMLTEADVQVLGGTTVEPTRLPTVFLMTTYYGGALLVAVAVLAVLLRATRFLTDDTESVRPPVGRRLAVYAVVSVLAGGAVVYSDPLYLIWFVTPLCLTVLVLLVLRRLTLRRALIIAFPQIVAFGLGMLARVVFARYIAVGLEQYLATYGVRQAAQLLGDVVVAWLGTPGGVIRLVVLLAPIAVAVVALVRGGRRASTGRVFLAVFSIAAFVVMIAVQILTGQSVTRYLLSLFVLPPVAYLLLPWDRVGAVLSRVAPSARIAAAALVAVAALVISGVSAPAVADLASSRSPVDSACLDRWVAAQPGGAGRPDGVGSFWTTRALLLYGTQSGRILQVKQPLQVHAWMNDLALYPGTTFRYVIADGFISVEDWHTALGDPASTTACHGYRILDYTGTPGQTTLNAALVRSEQELGLR